MEKKRQKRQRKEQLGHERIEKRIFRKKYWWVITEVIMINMSFQKDVVVEMEVVEVKRTMVFGWESERMNVCGSGSQSGKNSLYKRSQSSY